MASLLFGVSATDVVTFATVPLVLIDDCAPRERTCPPVGRRASTRSSRCGTSDVPLLFSYGTLQLADVQVATFGRLLAGEPDALIGFETGVLTIEDPEFVETSGKADHAIVTFTGKPNSRVPGMVFELSDDELASADAYEPAGYTRISTTLASGKQAWVYASK